jgi:hypothetical protein
VTRGLWTIAFGKSGKSRMGPLPWPRAKDTALGFAEAQFNKAT